MSTATSPVTTQEQPSAAPVAEKDKDRIDQAIGRMDDVLGQPEDVVLRQRELYGGMKFGSDFFGWLTATAMVVLLATLAGVAGLVVARSQDLTASDVGNSQPITLAIAVAFLVIILIGYLCGGYVAGRMARFNGGRQGIGVWLWAIVTTLVAGAVGWFANSQYGLLDRLPTVPRPTLDHQTLLWGNVAYAAAVVILSLVGAVLGGLAGMRFHRRVDRVELDPEA